ncbi:MAG: glycerol-3-phosphate transporter, partial [Alistipes sp.]|nr:glycerol-3-phosphate transporter [Alistipes sp.]
MWKLLQPPAHKTPIAPDRVDETYKRLRMQVFIGIFVGYAGYYLVRKNFTLAMPYLVELGFDKGDLGIALSANAIA